LHAVVYVSRATRVQYASEADCIAQILAVSARNNAANTITGALLACDGWFVQVLEGRRIDVEHTLRLLAEPRVVTSDHLLGRVLREPSEHLVVWVPLALQRQAERQEDLVQSDAPLNRAALVSRTVSSPPLCSPALQEHDRGSFREHRAPLTGDRQHGEIPLTRTSRRSRSPSTGHR
jgi:hypothetical protein